MAEMIDAFFGPNAGSGRLGSTDPRKPSSYQAGVAAAQARAKSPMMYPPSAPKRAPAAADGDNESDEETAKKTKKSSAHAHAHVSAPSPALPTSGAPSPALPAPSSKKANGNANKKQKKETDKKKKNDEEDEEENDDEDNENAGSDNSDSEGDNFQEAKENGGSDSEKEEDNDGEGSDGEDDDAEGEHKHKSKKAKAAGAGSKKGKKAPSVSPAAAKAALASATFKKNFIVVVPPAEALDAGEFEYKKPKQFIELAKSRHLSISDARNKYVGLAIKPYQLSVLPPDSVVSNTTGSFKQSGCLEVYFVMKKTPDSECELLPQDLVTLLSEPIGQNNLELARSFAHGRALLREAHATGDPRKHIFEALTADPRSIKHDFRKYDMTKGADVADVDEYIKSHAAAAAGSSGRKRAPAKPKVEPETDGDAAPATSGAPPAKRSKASPAAPKASKALQYEEDDAMDEAADAAAPAAAAAASAIVPVRARLMDKYTTECSVLMFLEIMQSVMSTQNNKRELDVERAEKICTSSNPYYLAGLVIQRAAHDAMKRGIESMQDASGGVYIMSYGMRNEGADRSPNPVMIIKYIPRTDSNKIAFHSVSMPKVKSFIVRLSKYVADSSIEKLLSKFPGGPAAFASAYLPSEMAHLPGDNVSSPIYGDRAIVRMHKALNDTLRWSIASSKIETWFDSLKAFSYVD